MRNLSTVATQSLFFISGWEFQISSQAFIIKKSLLPREQLAKFRKNVQFWEAEFIIRTLLYSLTIEPFYTPVTSLGNFDQKLLYSKKQ